MRIVRYPASGNVRKKPMTFPRNRNTPATKTNAPSTITRVLIIQASRCSLLQGLLQKLQPLHRNFIASRLDAAPDRRRAGDDLYVGSERFDHDVSVVLDRLERRSD